MLRFAVVRAATGEMPVLDLIAYLDVGSGSMILQLIAGGTAAVAVTAKLYWRRMLTFLRIRREDGDQA